MIQSSPRRFSVSTWSLHRTLGLTYPDAPGHTRGTAAETYGPGTFSLLEIPALLAARGIHTMEICHFQVPSRETAYLQELRAALDAAGVELFSVLIDDGDITHPTHAARDLAWIEGWIETAGHMGAKRARVIAGKADYSPQTMALSKQGMHTLAETGKELGVRVTTENWFSLLSRPEHVYELLDSLEGSVGLNADFGNWGGPAKYADLAAIFDRAESCHAKCDFTAPGVMDETDYAACLQIAREACFEGPYTLIYDSSFQDEWAGLKAEQEFIRPYLQ